MFTSIAPLFILSMANFFVLIILAPQDVNSKPTTIWSYPMAHMYKVEAELDEYLESNYHKTSKLHEAIIELEKIKPKSEKAEKLLADLKKIGDSVKLEEKPNKIEMELFEECRKMFAPLKESRQVLKKIRSEISGIERKHYSCYYIKQTKEDLQKAMEGDIEYYNKHKTAMLEEVQKKGYTKSEKALEEMDNAFDELNTGEIIRWARLAEEEILREVFGLYGILEKYPV